MLFDFTPAEAAIGDGLITKPAPVKWGVDSEYGRLIEVMLSAPPHLAIVPCNSVSIGNIEKGVQCCPAEAARQHAALVRTLEQAGVRCHLVPPVLGMPDLSFTRDTSLMTPWGLLPLSPAVSHRAPEVAHVEATVAGWGLPILDPLPEGKVEGGDVCILRPGVVAIGYSGERTDEAGANALARLFERHGWRAILCRFDPHFLHLDTLFTLVDRNCALACIEALSPDFLAAIDELGIDTISVTKREVSRLGANVLSLGDGRVLSSADNHRLNWVLECRGYDVLCADVDQFVRCGGGIHCLTMPLARRAG